MNQTNGTIISTAQLNTPAIPNRHSDVVATDNTNEEIFKLGPKLPPRFINTNK
ncbi:MAG TPA: hypothetical protein VKC90_03230 [Chitinophagaceae bacterium]|nr:hypothetical protein [Chitinophagaceae bacterium]